MRLELIVFDLASTTVKDNHDVHRTLQNAFAKYGVLISVEDADTVMGISKPLAIRTLLNTCDTFHGPITEDFVQEIHHTFVQKMIHFYQDDPSVGEKDGVSDTLRRLKERKFLQNLNAQSKVWFEGMPRKFYNR